MARSIATSLAAACVALGMLPALCRCDATALEDALVAEALELGDECFASDDAEACALNALQLRGQRRAASIQAAKKDAPEEEASTEEDGEVPQDAEDEEAGAASLAEAKKDAPEEEASTEEEDKAPQDSEDEEEPESASLAEAKKDAPEEAEGAETDGEAPQDAEGEEEEEGDEAEAASLAEKKEAGWCAVATKCAGKDSCKRDDCCQKLGNDGNKALTGTVPCKDCWGSRKCQVWPDMGSAFTCGCTVK